MRLPRWTTYPALATIAVLLVTALPEEAPERPAAGALARARAARAGGEQPETTYPRVVVLGIDGMDPDVLREVIAAHPEGMKNFRALADQGQGVLDLGTSCPPQSPVAWSNFITGRNPGGHGVFDFIHRSKQSYGIVPGWLTEAHAGHWWLPGDFRFPTSEGGESNRSGKAFWTILGERGVPADVWRMPMNFPIESGKGLAFSGMGTPALDSAYGEPTLYSTDPPASKLGNDKVIRLSGARGVFRTHLLGPENSFRDTPQRVRADLDVYVDEDAGAVAVQIADGPAVVLEPGQWSEFLPVTFSMLPAGAMDMNGIVRFYLRSVTPEVELYASPINVDPSAPVNPVSWPEDAAAWLADEIGPYYTQGMAEDVNGLKTHMLTDPEFMQQANLVYQERGRMLDLALDHYMDKPEGGLLFFYYSSVDLTGHMMWRHADARHPNHDAEFAAEDSSTWSGRDGSTWSDVITDLYLRMDPILGRIRERVGEDTLVLVMSDHGFAPFRRKFSLNTWLLENGYLVLNEGASKELDPDEEGYLPVFLQGKFVVTDEAGEPVLGPDGKPQLRDVVDWSRTRAFGIGFNGLYLNLEGREGQGSVKPEDAPALLAELKAGLEAIRDEDGTQVIPNADLASDVYSGERLTDAPDILVGYNVGYGNSDEASQGRIQAHVLTDNLGGTFNGSHLMDPRVVMGTLLTNGRVSLDDPRLEDLTVEILKQYGVERDPAMVGRPVLEDPR